MASTAPITPTAPAASTVPAPAPLLPPTPVASPVVPEVPVTPAANPDSLVVSAAPATQTFNSLSTALQGMLSQLNTQGSATSGAGPAGTAATPTLDNSQGDPYLTALDTAAATSGAATKALVSSIQAQRSQQGATIDAQYDNYKRGLQALGIEHNEAQATPDLLAGHIQQAENEHQTKITALNVAEQKALMDAESAQQKGDLSTLKDKMDYIKTLQTQKQDYLKNIADTMTSEKTIASDQVSQYYDALQSVPDDQKEQFLTTVAQKYGISLGSLTSAMVTEQEARQKDALTTASEEATLADKTTGKTLTPTQAKSYVTNNSLVDVSAGDTVADANAAVANAKIVPDWINSNYADSSNVDGDGYFTAEALNSILQKLPAGISVVQLMTNMKNDNQIPSKLESTGANGKPVYVNYGLTKAQADQIMAN